ncbi:unnamed protein product [Discosporangium mesarthrocarpum]
MSTSLSVTSHSPHPTEGTAPDSGDDPLDKPDFDPVDYLNHHFPTERSLERLDPFLVSITSQISDLDDEISKTVQAQSKAGQQAAKDVGEAKVAIKELFDKIRDMKAKAEQSEIMVQEICRDIKQLDFAKRHLQTTITALKRLHMLVTAVDQLQEVARARHYRESANLLDAVRQLLTHFESYAQVPRIAELRDTVTEVKNELVDQTLEAFNQVGQLASSIANPEGFERSSDKPGQFRSLHEACLVVDALGGRARQQQIESFCEQQMRPYGPLFPKGSDQSQLDQVDRRFAWFRRLLRGVDTRFDGVFPAHWRLQHRLCIMFLDQTRGAVLEVLESGSKEAEDVTVLLKALHKCLAFEKEAHARFEKEKGAGRVVTVEMDREGNLIDPNSAEGIKRKYAKAAMGGEEGHGNGTPKSVFAALSADGEGVKDEGLEVQLPAIIGLLSGVFDPFMGPYISLERRNLDDLITAASRATDLSDDIDRDGKLPVFRTSVNIFVYIKNSIQRCTKLTTGQTFFNLHQEFKTCLRTFVKLLKGNLPTPQTAVGGQQYRIPEDGEVTVCYTINTAEYCAEILPQLEEMIRSKMDPGFADKVDFAEEQELYYDVIAQAIRVLVAGVDARVEPAFRAMSTINWGNCEMVGEESHYVRKINDAFQQYIPVVRGLLSTLYFRQVTTNFCDKMVMSFLPSFLSLILRQRRVNEMGTQQLLLDVYNLKTLMLKVPSLGVVKSEATPVPVTYTKYVTKQMSKIEMVLKLVGTPQSMLVERFQIMWPDGGASDLQAIMTLKGMRKVDQQVVLDTLGMDRGSSLSVEAASKPGAAQTQGNVTSSAQINRISANMPKFEANTREIASKMENSVRSMTSNLQKLTFM